MADGLAELAKITESAQPGWTRRVFSDSYRASRQWVATRMQQAGLEVHVDGAGNIVGRLAGRSSALPPLMTGSHTDTVHGGGRFDGIVGVLGAIEAGQRIMESGTTLERDLVIVDFLGEEANPFGISCIGSRALAGRLGRAHLDGNDSSGQSLGAALTGFGLDPERVLDAALKPGSAHSYVELHVEQGPLLERSGTSIGVVTAIAGIHRMLTTFQGRADHAGTTAMSERRDALAAAAEAVLVIEREACGAPVHGVSTTGRIESSPGSFNVVPDEARLWAEMRSIDPDWLSGAKLRIAQNIAAEASKRGVHTLVEWLSEQRVAETNSSVQDHIASAATSLGLDWEAVPSGAGHDAAHMVHLGPMGMIFIPSVGGRSHVPEEFTEIDDIVHGVHTLASTLVQLDTTELTAQRQDSQ